MINKGITKMRVNELLEELIKANRDDSVVIEIQTPMGYETIEIENIHHYKWGVAIISEQIGCEIND